MSDFLSVASLWTPGGGLMVAVLCGIAAVNAGEASLFALSHDQLRLMRLGNSRDRRAARLAGDFERVSIGLSLWAFLLQLAYCAAGVTVSLKLIRSGRPGAAAVFFTTAAIALALLGDVIPRSFAASRCRTLAPRLSQFLSGLLRWVDRLIPTLTNAALMMRRAFWPDVVREPLLDTTQLAEAFDAVDRPQNSVHNERLILQHIFDLSNITAEEIMRPRGTYEVLSPPICLSQLRGEVPPGDLIAVQPATGDDVTSAVSLEDFSVMPEASIESYAEDVVFVPWCASAATTLQVLRDRYASVALVVNEHGEGIGLVTHDDLIDTVMSRDPSRVRRLLDREPVQELSDGVWQVEGMTTLRYLCRRIGLDFDRDEEPVVTVAGLFHHRLEHFPEKGAVVEWKGCRLEVVDVSERDELRVILKRELPS